MCFDEKCESVRYFGIEILRISRDMDGFEDVPDKITRFYENVVLAAAAGGKETLEELAKKAFEGVKETGNLSAAFFKRYNYLVLCEAEREKEKLLKVSLRVSLKRGTENLFYVENVHFWDIDNEFMMSKNGFKKALLKRDKIVKK